MSTEFVLTVPGGVISGRRADPRSSNRLPGGPLIIALHGGSYSSKYFDVPGCSLLDRAAAAGLSAVALDRPGYQKSTLLEPCESILDANRAVLDVAIAAEFSRESQATGGIVLVGHSIGAAVATLLASGTTSWPLAGIAVSGLGLTPPPGGAAYEEHGPTLDRLEVPLEVRNAAMFGPRGSYSDDAPRRAAVANEPVVYKEVAEMNERWASRAQDVYGRVGVPVFYRQGENDVIWASGEDELDRVRRAFSAAPSVDARLVEGAGHAIDFHHAGATLHAEQIAFALACAEVGQRG